MTANASYLPIPVSSVPSTVRWDTPRSCQGQIVEVNYSDAHPSRYEGGLGDEYMRRHDHASGHVAYYQRDGERWV